MQAQNKHIHVSCSLFSMLLQKGIATLKKVTLNLPPAHHYKVPYPVCEEYTFCSHLLPEKAMCLVFIMTT